MFVEVVGGYLANSLAIMTDAAHLMSDLAGFIISIKALNISKRKADEKMSYGYHRSEILGALGSIIIIWMLAIMLLYEGIKRTIEIPELEPNIMFISSILGLIFNSLIMWILHYAGIEEHGGLGHDHSHDGDHGHGHGHGHGHDHGHDHHDDHPQKELSEHLHHHSTKDESSINVKAAMIHIIGDMLQAIGVVVAAVIVYFGGPAYNIADPICTLFFAVVVFITTIPVTKDVIRILMEGVPEKVDIHLLRE